MTRARPEAEPTSFDAAGRPVLRCAIYTRQSVALDERFDDLGVSGGSLERPALRRLLSWCMQGRVDVVLVTSVDRLARKMSDWVRLNDWLKQAGIELVILQGAGGARGPLAELVYNVTASLAEFERDLIRERLREAKGRARARGRRAAGRVPLGYWADPNTRQLVVDSREGARVGPGPVDAARPAPLHRLRARDDDDGLGGGHDGERRRDPALLPLPWRLRASRLPTACAGLGAQGRGPRTGGAQESRPAHDHRPQVSGAARAPSSILGLVVPCRAQPHSARPRMVDSLEPAPRPRGLYPRHHRRLADDAGSPEYFV